MYSALAPGVLNSIDLYNSKIDASKSFDKKQLTTSFINSVHLLRYVTDYMYHKTYLGDQNLDKLTDFYILGTANSGDPALVNSYRNMLQNLSCQTARHSKNNESFRTSIIGTNSAYFINSQNIIKLIETDNYKQAVGTMLKCVLENAIANNMFQYDRINMRIYNILDANIVPINFHALQRELALSNIYNYSYTFDHYIREILEVRNSYTNTELATGFGESPDPNIPDYNFPINYEFSSDMLVQILNNPRGYRNVHNYVNGIWNLMSGNDGLGLSKPKYLSDQLWNKVLCNSIYAPGGVNQYARAQVNIGENKHLNKGYGSNRVLNMHLDNRLLEPATSMSDRVPPNNVSMRLETITYQANSDLPFHNNTNKHKINIVNTGMNPKIMTDMGYTRYQTILVRYIEWIVHMQRVMNLFMRDQLEWINDPVASGQNAIDTNVTEYRSNERYKLSDFE